MVTLLKNNLAGPLVLNEGFAKPLRLDGGAKVEISPETLFHPQIQNLLRKKVLSKIERKG